MASKSEFRQSRKDTEEPDILPRNFRINEIATIGLPIRITVLSIVVLVGFYAILSVLNSAPTPPESMFAISNISTFSIPPQGLGKKKFILM